MTELANPSTLLGMFGLFRMPTRMVLALGTVVFLDACSSPTPSASSTSTSQANGVAADVTVTRCRQDPTDDTQVMASGFITDHSSQAADYNFTVEWYLGSMLVTRSSVSQADVLPNASEGWTTQTGVAVPSAGPYTCRITRVVTSPRQ